MKPTRDIIQDLLEQRQAIAEASVARQYALHPSLEARYGKVGREKALQDALFNLDYLVEAVAASDPALFSEYVAWLKVTLARRNVPPDVVSTHLEILRDTIRNFAPQEVHQMAGEFIERALQKLQQAPVELPTFLPDDAPLAPISRAYIRSLLRGDRQHACQLILDAVKRGIPVKDLYLHVFERSQHEIGRLWQVNEISVAQEHFCTAATQLIMAQLYPQVFGAERKGLRMVATCVGHELHELGIRMVADFFEMEGWDTFYLGANTPSDAIIKMLIDQKAQVLAISTTITYHLRLAVSLIERVRSIEALRSVKILVGGYCFNVSPDLWQTIHADGYAPDAQEAIPLAGRLVGV